MGGCRAMTDSAQGIASRESSRLRAIDATRGTAMLFVFLSHFTDVYAVSDASQRHLRWLLHTVGLLATPTFLAISGISLGYLYRSKQDVFAGVSSRLLDRALFFLLVGHPLISLAYCKAQGPFRHALLSVYVTDAVAVCLILAPWLIQRLPAAIRLKGALAAYLCCWASVLLWHPSRTSTIALKEVLFGVLPEVSVLWYSFPLLTWLSLYLCCTVAGERVQQLATQCQRRQLLGFVVQLGLSSLAAGALFVAAKKALRSSAVLPAGFEDWLTIYQKSPPGPIYVLFFGGLGLLLFAFFLRYGELPLLQPYLKLVETLGRVSFFAFVLQYFLFELLLFSLHPSYSAWWPLYLLTLSVLICLAAWLWHVKGWNRFLSLRYCLRLLQGRGQAVAVKP